jgi:hypothetical protein
MTLLDGKTRGIPYPQAGYNCNAAYGMAQKSEGPYKTAAGDIPLYQPNLGNPALLKPAQDLTKLEHCPDFNERMTLLNGKTRGIPYPQAGYNCNAAYGMA